MHCWCTVHRWQNIAWLIFFKISRLFRRLLMSSFSLSSFLLLYSICCKKVKTQPARTWLENKNTEKKIFSFRTHKASTLIKKKIEFFSYIGKFRVEQLHTHSHIWGRASYLVPRLPPPPSPPSPVSKLYRRHTGRMRKRDNLLTGHGGGGNGWARSRIIRPQESLGVYKSFKTLWYDHQER
jgi:hypothetical protein